MATELAGPAGTAATVAAGSFNVDDLIEVDEDFIEENDDEDELEDDEDDVVVVSRGSNKITTSKQRRISHRQVNSSVATSVWRSAARRRPHRPAGKADSDPRSDIMQVSDAEDNDFSDDDDL